MSDSTITIDEAAVPPSAAPARTWAEPDSKGHYPDDAMEHVYAPANLGALLLIEQPGGWLSGWEAALPEAPFLDAPTVHQVPHATRELAIGAACERLIAWCGEQKTKGKRKHKEAAGQLQDWALNVENRAAFAEQIAAPTADALAAHYGEPAGTFYEGPAGGLHTSASGMDGELRTIPIADLHESPLNPRQIYPEAAMAELAQSMRADGFRPWLPLVVRPIPANPKNPDSELCGYEIAAGHRRRRAAEQAGIALIPCIVREMTDEQFLDVLNFDNSGREDVHPLHEAAGWRVWMQKTGKSVIDIASRIGQSKEYVYQRLKYADLIPEAAEAFLNRRITAGHAILIARLEPAMQARAIEDGCFQRRGFGRRGLEQNLISVRDLAEWIEEQDAGADLTEAPFDRNDAELVKAAGACGPCVKRAEDFCTDRPCFDEKVEAHIRAKAAAGLVAISTQYEVKGVPAGVINAWEFEEIYDRAEDVLDDPELEDDEEPAREIAAAPEDDPDACSFAEDAIVAHGRDRGKVKRICRNPKCPIHGRRLNRALQAKADEPKDFWSERAKTLPHKIDWESRCAVLKAVLAQPFQWNVPHEQLQLVALSMVGMGLNAEFLEALDFPDKAKFKNASAAAAELQKKIRAPKGSPASDWLPRIVMGLSLLETAKEYCYKEHPAYKRLLQAAQVLGVDAKAIAQAVSDRITADFKARRDKARAKAKPAPKPKQEPAKSAAVASKPAQSKPAADTRKAAVAKLPTLAEARAGKKPAAKKAPAKKKAAPAAKLTAAARERIAAQQKKRWAEHRKQAAAKK